jgi:hypothetical protein
MENAGSNGITSQMFHGSPVLLVVLQPDPKIAFDCRK